jgi:hypothetical protein
MFEGANNVASKVHPTSHLFSCKMDNLNMSNDESFSHSLIWAKHLDPIAYKHGQKYHHRKDYEEHMRKDGCKYVILNLIDKTTSWFL